MTPPATDAPSLRSERVLLRSGHQLVAGVDEVGRGCLAGPVTVGVAVVDASTPTAPVGLRDSKDLRPAVREALAPKLHAWAVQVMVGSASAGEIDELGIIGGLRLAAKRAFAQGPAGVSAVILDGTHNWLAPGADWPDWDPHVVTGAKGDSRCSSVAAASVVAKCHRDAVMRELDERWPGYGWADNKGYAAPVHVAGLAELGPCVQHRRSWNLPGVGPRQETLPL